MEITVFPTNCKDVELNHNAPPPVDPLAVLLSKESPLIITAGHMLHITPPPPLATLLLKVLVRDDNVSVLSKEAAPPYCAVLNENLFSVMVTLVPCTIDTPPPFPDGAPLAMNEFRCAIKLPLCTDTPPPFPATIFESKMHEVKFALFPTIAMPPPAVVASLPMKSEDIATRSREL
jgi:hypothetical protein